MIKKILKGAVGIIGFLCLVIAALVIYFKTPSGQAYLVQNVQKLLEKQSSIRVTFEELQAAGPRSFSAKSLSIKNLDNENILSAKKVEIRWSAVALLKGQIPLTALYVDLMEVHLDKLKDFEKDQKSNSKTKLKVSKKSKAVEGVIESLLKLPPQSIKIKTLRFHGLNNLLNKKNQTGAAWFENIKELEFNIESESRFNRYHLDITLREKIPDKLGAPLTLNASVQIDKKRLSLTFKGKDWPHFLPIKFPKALKPQGEVELSAPLSTWISLGKKQTPSLQDFDSRLRLYLDFEKMSGWDWLEEPLLLEASLSGPKGKSKLTPNQVLIDQINIDHPQLQLSGSGTFNLESLNYEMDLQGVSALKEEAKNKFKLLDLKPVTLRSSLKGNLEGFTASTDLETELIHFPKTRLSENRISLETQFTPNQGLQNRLSLKNHLNKLPCSAKAILNKNTNEPLLLQNLDLKVEGNTLHASALKTSSETPGLMLELKSTNLNWLSELISQPLNLKQGHLKAEIYYSSKIDTLLPASIQLYSQVYELSAPHFQVQEARLINRVEIKDWRAFTQAFTYLDGTSKFSCKGLTVSHGKFNEAELLMNHTGKETHFDLELKQAASDPFSPGLLAIEIEGTAKQDELKDLKLEIEEVNGRWLNQSLRLEKPVLLHLYPQHAKLSELDLRVGKGFLRAELTKEKSELLATLQTSELPMLLFSQFTKFSFDGKASGNLAYEKKGDQVSGLCKLNLKDFEFSDREEPEQSAKLHGKLEAFLKGNILDTHLNLSGNGHQDLDLQLSSPVIFSKKKYQANESHPLNAKLKLKGAVDPILRALLPEHIRVKANVEGQFDIRGTLLDPLASGTLHLNQGSYEDFHLGTQLKQARAKITADKNHLILNSLEAEDGVGGNAKAQGQATLSLDFPHEIDLNLNQFRVINLDLAEASGTGNAQFKGDLSEASLNGALTLTKTLIKIPDQITASVPELSTYIIEREKIKDSVIDSTETKIKKRYHINLNLDIEIPDQALILGRGLDANWGGHVSLQGTHLAPNLIGKVAMSDGELNLGGRRFNITEGSLQFKGHPRKDSHLYIVSEFPLEAVTIKAILKGPLNDPQVEFKATPSIPVPDIFSQILFGTNVKGISPIQAYQVAQLALEVSGDSRDMDLISLLRKKAHIDQFYLKQNEATLSESDPDSYSLKVGKYLAKDFLVSVSKDMSNEGTEFEIELDLTQHLSLITQFGYLKNSNVSLMWKKSY